MKKVTILNYVFDLYRQRKSHTRLWSHTLALAHHWGTFLRKKKTHSTTCSWTPHLENNRHICLRGSNFDGILPSLLNFMIGSLGHDNCSLPSHYMRWYFICNIAFKHVVMEAENTQLLPRPLDLFHWLDLVLGILYFDPLISELSA